MKIFLYFLIEFTTSIFIFIQIDNLHNKAKCMHNFIGGLFWGKDWNIFGKPVQIVTKKFRLEEILGVQEEDYTQYKFLTEQLKLSGVDVAVKVSGTDKLHRALMTQINDKQALMSNMTTKYSFFLNKTYIQNKYGVTLWINGKPKMVYMTPYQLINFDDKKIQIWDKNLGKTITENYDIMKDTDVINQTIMSSFSTPILTNETVQKKEIIIEDKSIKDFKIKLDILKQKKFKDFDNNMSTENIKIFANKIAGDNMESIGAKIKDNIVTLYYIPIKSVDIFIS